MPAATPTPEPIGPVPTPRVATPMPSASGSGAAPPGSSPLASPSSIIGPGIVGSLSPPDPARPKGFDIPAGVVGTVTFEGGGVGMIGPFVVPGFLAAASGFLLILLMLAQALGALAWLPVVRRRIGSFGINPRG